MNADKVQSESNLNGTLNAINFETLITNRLQDNIKNGDRKGTDFIPMRFVNYKPAEVRVTGKKMFIQFSFRHPITQRWIRFKKYGVGQNMGLNRIGDVEERAKVARRICRAYNELFSEGYIPPEFNIRKEEGPRNWTMFQALNLWKLNTENKADRKPTVDAYSFMVNSYLKKFKKVHHPIAEITRTDIENFLLTLKKVGNHTNTTYNSYLRYTKVFFNYCVSSELLSKSPATAIRMLKAVALKHKYFSDEEFEKVKKHAPEKLFKFMEFLYETALRPKEARLMKFKYVMDDRLFVPGSISKNKKDEYVPLSVEYAKKLQGEPDDYIFGGKKSIGDAYYGRMFKELRELLQMDSNYDLYSLKHTRAYHLAKAKVDPYSIMNLFRHSSLEITMKYLRSLSIELNREAVDKGKGF